MTEFPFDIVGFDLDGTLIDSSGDLTNAVNHALALGGLPPLAVERVETMIGGGAKHMLAQAYRAAGGADQDEFRRLYKAMLAYYGDHLAVESHPFPGAIEALDELAARGVTLAIVTNKFEGFAESLLGQLGLRDRFAALIGGDTLGPGLSKPHRAPIDAMIERCGGGRAVFIGDSIYDIEAAKNAGIPSIAVSFGFLMQPVETLGADAVLDSYVALPATLESLGGASSKSNASELM